MKQFECGNGQGKNKEKNLFKVSESLRKKNSLDSNGSCPIFEFGAWIRLIQIVALIFKWNSLNDFFDSKILERSPEGGKFRGIGNDGAENNRAQRKLITADPNSRNAELCQKN